MGGWVGGWMGVGGCVCGCVWCGGGWVVCGWVCEWVGVRVCVYPSGRIHVAACGPIGTKFGTRMQIHLEMVMG